MDPSPGPPNPRQARFRRMQVTHWSAFPLTIAIIAVCCVVGLVSGLGNNTRPVSWMFYSDQGPLELLDQLELLQSSEEPDPQAIAELTARIEKGMMESRPLGEIGKGQVWRLVTPVFLHFGILHLAFNMLWMWTLGRLIEPLLGRLRFALLILIIAICSNTAEALISGTNFGGMSGVIYGLFGYLVIFGKFQPAAPRLDSGTVFYMLVWMVICFTPFIGHIANWAHCFGLASGAVIGAIQGMRNGGLERLRRRHDFHTAIQESVTGALHECAICHKTEHHDPDLEFRVGNDGKEYCMNHLPERHAK